MISASQTFIDAVAQSSRRFRMRMYDGNTEIAGSLRSVKVHLGSTGPEVFAIGAVYSGYAEIVLDGRETTLEGKELRLDVGVMTDTVNETYDYITLGYYTALAPSATKYRTTLTACGRIVSKLAVTDFVAPATQTLQAVADAITTQTGVSVVFDSGIDTSLVIDTPITGNCRDALTRLAECVMGYATETNAGNVRIARFATTPTATYDAADMITLPAITDINFEITGVQAITNTGVFETGTPNVSIESNYISEALFNEFAPGLAGIEYRPGTVSLALGDPRIEPSDVLSVTVDSDVYVVPCFSITHTFDGGLQTSIVTPSVQNVGKVTGTLSQAVQDAKEKADQAAAQVNDAKKVATSYLTRDNTGIMVADLSGGTAYTPSTIPAGHVNAFINPSAFQIRDGQTVLASYGTETSIYTTDGTELVHFGYASGNSGSGTAIKPYYTIGQRAAGSEIGNWSLALGLNCVASGEMSISAGIGATASGGDAVAIGNNATASGGDAIAIGTDTESSGMGSIATGVESEASGRAATSMGLYTKAVGDGSFAAGRNTSTTGWYATAFGERCVASGWGAMASGHFTEAASEYQSVRGKYNIPDENDKYAEIVGNGDEYNQSNAYALTWDGDIQFKIDTAAASGTVDRALYTELTAYGFETVIDSDGMISLKKLLTQIIQRL